MVYPDFQHAVTPEEGVLAALVPSAKVSFTKGCEPEMPIDGGIDAAIAAAKEAEIVVM